MKEDVRREIEAAPELEPVADGPRGLVLAPVPPPVPDDAGGPSEPPRPLIRIERGELPSVINESEAALIAANAGLYQRSGAIVRPCLEQVPAADRRQTRSYRLVAVKPAHVRECFMRVANYERFDGRTKKYVAADCPGAVADAYCARAGELRLPPIVAVTTAPTLRWDGSIIDCPGYDVETGLFFDPCGQAFPAIPASPTRADAERALERLSPLLDGYPFVAAVDRAVALSGMLTALTRRSLSVAPLHAVTAPAPGSGKSHYVDLSSSLATGELAAVIAQASKEDETEKRFDASMIAGDALISIDNCEHALSGSWLAAATTQPRLRIRVLGLSLNVELPNTAMLFATGNNLVLAGDMARRVLLCRLDPGIERPEKRTFASDPLEMIRRARGEYVVAGLTVLRAYICAGRPAKLEPIGSFEDWSRVVRGALVWLGQADPAQAMETSYKADIGLERARALFRQWHAVLGDRVVGVRDLIETANMTREEVGDDQLRKTIPSYADFRDALLAVAGDRGRFNNKKLGWWLRGYVKRIIGGLMLVKDEREDRGSAQWQVRRVESVDH